MNEPTDRSTGFYAAELCDLIEFKAITARVVDMTDIPHASGAPKKVPLYDMNRLKEMLAEPEQRRVLMVEWAKILLSGPGVFVLKSACTDLAAIDAATAVFNDVIAAEKAGAGGGYSAKARPNSRQL